MGSSRVRTLKIAIARIDEYLATLDWTPKTREYLLKLRAKHVRELEKLKCE